MFKFGKAEGWTNKIVFEDLIDEMIWVEHQLSWARRYGKEAGLWMIGMYNIHDWLDDKLIGGMIVEKEITKRLGELDYKDSLQDEMNFRAFIRIEAKHRF